MTHKTPARPSILRSGRPFAALAAMLMLGMLAFGAGSAQAQSPTTAQRNAIKANCQSDFMAQCSGVTPGGSAALQCLQQHSAALSPACRQAVGSLSGAGSPAPAAPPPAAAAPAPAPAAPAPAAAAAPAATAPAAAAPPAAPMRTFTPREEIFIVRETCGIDFRRFCGAVPLGGGRAIACLQSNAARLSPACKRVLSAGL